MGERIKLRGKELLEREKQLAEYAGRDKIISSHELADELKKTEESMFNVQTGVKSLDRILGGVEAGELIVVTGPTGEGKTTLLMTITKNMAVAAVNTVWFTLEVTPRQFLQKLVASSQEEAKDTIPLFYLPAAGIDDADEPYVKQWEAKHRRRYEMVDWIEDKIIEAKVKVDKEDRQIRAVFIDHIHQIFPMAKMQNVSLEIGDLVARIKNIALTHGLVIFLIAHTKDDPQGTAREPRKEDIRDSGLITRLADSIIGVWRIKNSNDGTKARREEIDEEDNKAKIRIFKNRRKGTVGFFTMYHKDHYLTEDFDFDAALEKQADQNELAF